MTLEERKERFNQVFDELMDCPVEEQTGRLVALLNDIAGFPEGEGLVWK